MAGKKKKKKVLIYQLKLVKNGANLQKKCRKWHEPEPGSGIKAALVRDADEQHDECPLPKCCTVAKCRAPTAGGHVHVLLS